MACKSEGEMDFEVKVGHLEPCRIEFPFLSLFLRSKHWKRYKGLFQNILIAAVVKVFTYLVK